MVIERGTDFELVDATLSGDTNAYRVLVERYELRVYRFLLKQVVHADDAEDLAQETFLQAYRSLASCQRDGQFITWVIGIALNVARNHHNRSRPPGADENTGDEIHTLRATTGDPVDEAQNLALLRALHRAIIGLPQEQRECVTLIALEGLSYEDARLVLGVPVGTIKSRLARARATLAQAIEGHR